MLGRGFHTLIRNALFLSPTDVRSNGGLELLQNPNRTISASGGLGLLQMVSEPDTWWCANEDTGVII